MGHHVKARRKSRGVLRETYWKFLRDPDRRPSESVNTGIPTGRPTGNHATGSSVGSAFLFVEYRGKPWNPVGACENPRNTQGEKPSSRGAIVGPVGCSIGSS